MYFIFTFYTAYSQKEDYLRRVQDKCDQKEQSTNQCILSSSITAFSETHAVWISNIDGHFSSSGEINHYLLLVMHGIYHTNLYVDFQVTYLVIHFTERRWKNLLDNKWEIKILHKH